MLVRIFLTLLTFVQSFSAGSRPELQIVPIINQNGYCSVSKLTGLKTDAPINIIIHAWKMSCSDFVYKDIGAALNLLGENVICADWKDIANNNDIVEINTGFVGYCLENFINTQITSCYPNMTMNLITYSLGAHVAGIAGRIFHSKTGKQLDKIIALDPSLISYHFDREYYLKPTDAKHVIDLQTNAGICGTKELSGTTNFIANGGVYQTGCPLSFDKYVYAIGCSHHKSISYFVEALFKNRFVGVRCTFLQNTWVYEQRNIDNTEVFNNKLPLKSGNFCFNTNFMPPYGLG